ncbi:hypothetical protein KAX02_07345 [candidate division WOR-3 bacterium]|nr:hypothetical protein [candidate division WOR-3 bacterium]
MNKDEIQEIRKECDNYKHTVWALLAFANHSRWDSERNQIYPDSKYSLGRRMTTKEGNPVTPDLVVQRTHQYGLVCEAKRDLPMNQTLWDKPLKQLIKYDMITEGWFTSTHIDNYDVAFLTDISRSVEFGDFFEKSDRKWKHQVAVIGFEHTPETTDIFITLKKERGALSDFTLDESLRRVTKVPLSKIETSIGKIKFYDDEPVPVYTARIFWEEICSIKISSETWSKDKKAHILQLTVEEITKELQEFYGQPSRGEREQEIPNKTWVKNVLNFLVDTGHAKKSKEDEIYTIFWKKIRGDILERFSRDWIKLEEKRDKKTHKKSKQLGLFKILEAE